jgi:O-methyltransferase involved in polyketide biosynthesis
LCSPRFARRYLPFDLNRAASESILPHLLELGLDPSLPTLFVFEAVLFYVDNSATRPLLKDLLSSFSSNPNAMLCMTDSLKPYVDTSFAADVKSWLRPEGWKLVQHSARWGGAVHFLLAAADPAGGGGSALLEHCRKERGEVVESYAPVTPPRDAKKRATAEGASFDDAW